MVEIKDFVIILLFICHQTDADISLKGSNTYIETNTDFVLTCSLTNMPTLTIVSFYKDETHMIDVVYQQGMCFGDAKNPTVAGGLCSTTNICGCTALNYTWAFNGEISNQEVKFTCKILMTSTPAVYQNSTIVVCMASMPLSDLLITQQPDDPVMKNGTVLLTCEVRGGIPLATLSFDCAGSSAVITAPSIDKVVSTVQLVVNSKDNGKKCTCNSTHPLWDNNKSTTVTIVVYYLPMESLVLTMEPSGILYIGNTINATCHLTGGNPLATLILNCNGMLGFKLNTTTTAFSTVVFTVNETFNGKQCVCTATHPVDGFKDVLSQKFDVQYAPFQLPVITQSQPQSDFIYADTILTLSCDVSGGNPLAVLYWNCDKNIAVTNNTSGNKSSYSVTFRVGKQDNGRLCTCSATHPVQSYRPSDQHEIKVYFKPFLDYTRPYSPSHVTVTENITLQLTLTINANPTPLIEWTFRGEADWNSCNFIALVSNTTTIGSITASSVLIENFHSSNFGDYAFTANNTAGIFFRRFVVRKDEQEMFASTRDNTGILVAGISTLIAGLLSLTTAAICVARNGFKNKGLHSSSKSRYYNDIQRSNPAFTDVYSTIQSDIESRSPNEQIINTYEECGIQSAADTSLDQIKSGPRKPQQHGVDIYEECGKRIDSDENGYDHLNK